MDGNCLDAQVMSSAGDAQRNFTPVRNQNLANGFRSVSSAKRCEEFAKTCENFAKFREISVLYWQPALRLVMVIFALLL